CGRIGISTGWAVDYW
nr:immunoglobulin heavy chain junction region [Macaca mulatta]